MSDLEDFDPDGGSSTEDDHRLADAEPTAQPEDAPRDDNDDPVLPDDSGTDTQHTVSESADKIVLKADVKRGNGTRDQDKINVKVKGNDPADTAAKLADTLDALAAEGVATTLRETQPEDNDE